MGAFQQGAERLEHFGFARGQIDGAFHQGAERLEHLARGQMAGVWFSLSTVKRRKLCVVFLIIFN